MRILRAAALLVALHVVISGGVAGAQAPDDAPSTTVPPETGTPPPGSEVISGPLVSWSIVPATAEGTPAEGVSFRLEVDPGATITEHALVTNHSEETVTFDLAGADGVVSPEGNFDVLPSGEESSDIGTWIAIQPTVEVEAGASVLVPFTITVPADATPGDHPGGIVAGVTRSTDQGEGPRVGFNTRVGIRIHLRVAGEIQPTVEITGLRATYEGTWNPFAPGSVHVTYTVTNTGNVRLGSRQLADIAGPFGLPTGADTGEGGVVGEQREILPGQSTTVDTVIEGVWPLGRVSTEIDARQQAVGDDVAFASAPIAASSVTTWAPPWVQLGLLLVLIVGVVLWRRRRAARRARHEAAIAEAKAAGAREAAASMAAREPGPGADGDDTEGGEVEVDGGEVEVVEVIDVTDEPASDGGVPLQADGDAARPEGSDVSGPRHRR